jgi:hypothetical protein
MGCDRAAPPPVDDHRVECGIAVVDQERCVPGLFQQAATGVASIEAGAGLQQPGGAGTNELPSFPRKRESILILQA